MGSGDSPELGLQGRQPDGNKNRKWAATRFQRKQTLDSRSEGSTCAQQASGSQPCLAHLSPQTTSPSAPHHRCPRARPEEKGRCPSPACPSPISLESEATSPGDDSCSPDSQPCVLFIAHLRPRAQRQGGPAPHPWPCSQCAEYKLTRQSSSWEHTNVCVFPEPWLRPAEPARSWSRGRSSHPGEMPCQPLSPDPGAQQELGALRTLIQAVGRPGHLVCVRAPQRLLSQVTVAS